MMRFPVGLIVFLLYAVLSGLTFRKAWGHWAVGQEDLGFWFTVVAILLGIAGTGALVGWWIHSRPTED